MPKPLLNKYFAWAAVIMVAFIVYGSLYPFDFHAREGAGPLAMLLATWSARPDQFGNLIGNIFLYMPLGLFGMLSMGGRIRGYLRLGLIVAIGAALCVSIELVQHYVEGRISTFSDIYPNVLGTGIGAAAGLVLGVDFRWPLRPTLRMQSVPILLLFAFLAYRLFPYVPSLDLHQYWQALKPVVLHPDFNRYEIARYTVMWLVVAALGQALVGAARTRWLLAPAMLGLLCAQVGIMNNSVSAAEIVGVAAAFVCWLALSRIDTPMQSIVIAVALAFVVIAERLQPFHFLATANAFGWVPFQSFMHGSMAVNTQSFLEKFFLYGGLIWLLTRAGAGLAIAGVAVALALLATGLLQTYLPGRSAEVTDAVMTLFIAGIFALIARTVTASGQARTRPTKAAMFQTEAAVLRGPDPVIDRRG